jgi:hypothetical protein
MAKSSAPRWFRFDLSFLLFWVAPYVAITAALLNCHGPYASEFLNRHVRLTLALGNTLLWAALWASAQAARGQNAELSETTESSPPDDQRSANS